MKSEEVIKIWQMYKSSGKRDAAFDAALDYISKILGISHDEVMSAIAKIAGNGAVLAALSIFASDEPGFLLIKRASPAAALSTAEDGFQAAKILLDELLAASDVRVAEDAAIKLKALSDISSPEVKIGVLEAMQQHGTDPGKFRFTDSKIAEKFKQFTSYSDSKTQNALLSLKQFYDGGRDGIFDRFYDLKGSPLEGAEVVKWAAKGDDAAKARLRELVGDDPSLSKDFWKGKQIGKSMASVDELTFKRALTNSGISPAQHAKILSRFTQNAKILEKEIKAAEGLWSIFKKIFSSGSGLTFAERGMEFGKVGFNAAGKIFELIKLIPRIGAIVGVSAAGLGIYGLYNYITSDEEKTVAPGSAKPGTPQLTGNLYDRILQTIRLE